MRFQLIVIGTSAGGIHALTTLLGGLPATFPLPLAIVQHRGVEWRDSLSAFLQKHSGLPVEEVEDKREIAGGRVYVAPSDYHVLIEEPGTFALSTDAPVLAARPSIDVLFESAADVCGDKVIGVLLTGASADGARGLARIRQRGGHAIVQDPTTAECQIMPKAGLAATVVDRVLPLDAIAGYLGNLVNDHES